MSLVAAVPRPVVIHAAGEPSELRAVDSPARAEVYRRDAGDWVQFWLYFADNPQDRGILRTGRPPSAPRTPPPPHESPRFQ